MRNPSPVLVLAALATLALMGGCGGGGGDDSPGPPVNVVPQANAGAAQSVTSGVTVTLNGSASNDPDGSIATYAWSQTAGPAVTLSNPAGAQTTFTAPTVATATSLNFSLVVSDNSGAASAAAVIVVTVNPPPVSLVTVNGTVRFQRAPFAASPFRLNYAAPVLQPARGVIVRLLNAGTGAVLASGATDSSGNYSLGVPGNTDVSLQAVARMVRDATQPAPRWDVRVQDGTAAGTAPYVFTGASFNSSAGSHNVDIPMNIASGGTATGTRHSGPFAILDTIYTAIQAVVGVSPSAVFPELYVDWGASASGTFFTTASGQHITLRADLASDTEEFDQHVVAHEFGHYIEHNFSRSDSIGGPHALGDKLDARVAFGEGFGYAFAAIVLNDPIALDSFNDSGTQRAGGFNVEVNPGPNSGNDPTGCWCSESSVWSILWDLYDPPNPGLAIDNDTIGLGLQPLWDVLIGAQKDTPAFTTIFSFITALKQARPGDTAAINALVASQNINAATIDAFATTETNQPFPNVLPLYAAITRGGPAVVVRSIDDGGLFNRAGNRRYVRYDAASSGTVAISLATANPATGADPDFRVYNNGVVRASRESPPPGPETGNVATTSGQTYLIDAYDCANGCSTEQGVRGDYDLTVTLN